MCIHVRRENASMTWKTHKYESFSLRIIVQKRETSISDSVTGERNKWKKSADTFVTLSPGERFCPQLHVETASKALSERILFVKIYIPIWMSIVINEQWDSQSH